MKQISIEKMNEIEGGSNRQCLIDGALTLVGIGLGVATAGLLGGAIALVGGLYAGNSNGCFDE